MTHIRFLSPFVFFLCMFFVSGAAAYFFYNEKMRLEQETQKITTNQLGSSGSLFKSEADLQGVIRALSTPIGIREGLENPDAILGSDLAAGKLKDNARLANNLIRRHADAIRRLAHIKTQHQIDFSGVAALPLAEQLSAADSALNALEAAIDSSIDFILRDTGEPGSGVIADQPNMRREVASQYATFRNAVGTVRSDAKRKVNEVRGALAAIRQANESRGGAPENQTVMRQRFSEASSACNDIIQMMSYATVDNERLPIPGLIDSPAKRLAVQLWYYLHMGTADVIKRPAWSDHTSIPDPIDAGSKAIRTLVQDFYQPISERQFNTSPFYLPGVTIESVIDNQDLLIEMLQSQNARLAHELVLTLAIYHSKDPIEMLQGSSDRRWRGTRTLINENRTQAETTNNGVIAAFRQFSDQENARANSADDARRIADEQELRRDREFWRNEVQNLESEVFRLKQKHDSLVSLFYRTKPDMFRQTGTIQHIGADGKILWLDKVDNIFHIDLGAGDKIHKGMRFIVYSDLGGRTEIKGLIEVTRLPTNNFAVCRLVAKFPNSSDILVGDKIENRLYHKDPERGPRFLRVALVGEFRPPRNTVSQEEVERYLRELGCSIQEEPDPLTELVILAEPAENMVPTNNVIARYIGAFGQIGTRRVLKMDEVLVEDIMIYFEE